MDENREERFYDLLEADENDAEAQYQIGLCYLSGDGTDKDTQKAETYFRRASELGHAAAAEMLGKGSIADQSPNTEDVSLPELCLRAEEGDADAQYAAAMQFLENNRSEAQRYLRMAAEQGHAMACYQLARTMLPDTLDYGCAVHEEQPTYQEAVTLLKNAVDCSCAPAAELLARCYLYGLGVAHDREQAEKNFERAVRFSTPEQAAEQMLQLALRYAEGEDIDKSLGKAFSWVRKAEQVAVPRRGASCYGKNAKNTMRIFGIPTIFLYYLLYFCVSIRDIVGFPWCEPTCNNFIYCYYNTRFAPNQPVSKPSSIATGCKTQRHKL